MLAERVAIIVGSSLLCVAGCLLAVRRRAHIVGLRPFGRATRDQCSQHNTERDTELRADSCERL
jgi:hypothetical protein